MDTVPLSFSRLVAFVSLNQGFNVVTRFRVFGARQNRKRYTGTFSSGHHLWPNNLSLIFWLGSIQKLK